MRIERIIVEDSNLESIALLVKKYHGSQYICVTDDMITIGNEAYAYAGSSLQWNMVVLKRIEHTIQVDILGLAGGSGVFKWSYGSEKYFVRNMKNVLLEYCNQQGLNFSVVGADEGIRKY